MNKLAIVLAVGAAALLGGTAANADNSVKKTEGAAVGTSQSTDFSAHRRHFHYGHRHHRHYGSYAYVAPRSYAYVAPRRAYYAPPAYYAEPYGGYGYGGPIISLGIGGGGFGFGGGHHHHHHGW